ncbi:hypothetical protein [Prochlorococcus marinus]|uniref:hypothetical protein n=1 Tax=Prochlorococcus marinus TaxID=1219 RepID=UPI0022B5811B|nr:hypothetical protein [Prochlorococcus marinus]
MESDLITILFSALFSLGGFIALISGFESDDDDDQDGGGTAEPVYSMVYAKGMA